METTPEIETVNDHLVGVLRGDRVTMVIPPIMPMERDEALRLAAWIVVCADPGGDRFAAVLEAVTVESTVDVAAIPERVAAGAEHLDHEAPGWWQRIRLDELDLATDCGCVLGQLAGGYMDGVDTFHVPDPDALGFHARIDFGDEIAEYFAEYAALTAEWKRVIAARRAIHDAGLTTLLLPLGGA